MGEPKPPYGQKPNIGPCPCLVAPSGTGHGLGLLGLAAARQTTLVDSHKVLYAASGPNQADIMRRIISAETGGDYPRLKQGRLTDHEQQVARQLVQAPLLIDDGSDLTAEAIAETDRYVQDLALVVVDRLQDAHNARLPLSGDRLPAASQVLASRAYLACAGARHSWTAPIPHFWAALTRSPVPASGVVHPTTGCAGSGLSTRARAATALTVSDGCGGVTRRSHRPSADRRRSSLVPRARERDERFKQAQAKRAPGCAFSMPRAPRWEWSTRSRLTSPSGPGRQGGAAAVPGRVRGPDGSR